MTSESETYLGLPVSEARLLRVSLETPGPSTWTGERQKIRDQLRDLWFGLETARRKRKRKRCWRRRRKRRRSHRPAGLLWNVDLTKDLRGLCQAAVTGQHPAPATHITQHLRRTQSCVRSIKQGGFRVTALTSCGWLSASSVPAGLLLAPTAGRKRRARRPRERRCPWPPTRR